MNIFPSKKDDWKKIGKNKVTIALNVLQKGKNISCLCLKLWKHNSNHEKRVILLMIWNWEKYKAKSKQWRLKYYLAVKKLPALLRWITSKYCDDFCCLNCLHSLKTENKLESLKQVREI